MNSHPENPNAQEVLQAVKNLDTRGTLAEDMNGMIYLNLDNEWIHRALAVLHGYGYVRPPFFVYPPVPVGAHIQIVTKVEAEKYEMFAKRDIIGHLLGKTVNFEVVKAHVSYPRIEKYGIEARYKIRVKSPELSEIRKELTGLKNGPNNGHFVILVGVRNPELNEEMKKSDEMHEELESNDLEEFEKQLGPEEKHGELDDTEDDDSDDY